MREFLEVVSEVPYDKKGLVIGDMLELGEYSHYWHRKLAHWLKRSGVQYLILVGNEVKYTLQETGKKSTDMPFMLNGTGMWKQLSPFHDS